MYDTDPNLTDGEVRGVFDVSTVWSTAATSGQYGCVACMEIFTLGTNKFDAGDKGLLYCWKDASSQAGESTAYVTYGVVEA